MATPVSDNVLLPVVDGGNGILEDEFINGLVQGGSWTFSGPRVLTYSLNINDLTDLDGNPVLVGGEHVPGPGGTWGASPTMATAVAQALAAWANVANISFQQQPVDPGEFYFQSTADLSFTLTGNDLGSDGSGTVGLGIFPDPVLVDQLLAGSGYDRSVYPSPEGDIALDNYSSAFSSVAAGSAGFQVILHEIGHALGLKHTDDDGGNGGPTFSELGIGAYESVSYTIMDSVVPASGPYAATPMLLDILAIQQIYGANMSYHAGDDIYVLANDGVLTTIWDASGMDALDARGSPRSAWIDLRMGGVSGLTDGLLAPPGPYGTVTVAFDATIENAYGSALSDQMWGNDSDNYFFSYAGNDVIRGGGGNDTYDIGSDEFGINADVIEEPGEGNDTVIRGNSYILPPNVENLVLVTAGFGETVGIGNELDNEITGGDGLDILSGEAGNDTLYGGYLLDTLAGGSGDDSYTIDLEGNASFVMYGQPGNALLDNQLLSLGAPAISFSYDLSDLTNDGVIDTLSALVSNDSVAIEFHFSTRQLGVNLAPGFYDDAMRYMVEDPGHAGIDLKVNGVSSQDVTGNFTITEASFDYTGTTVRVVGFHVFFSHFASGIELDGQLHLTSLPGGYYDIILENADDGTDVVESSTTYELSANVENLILTGAANLNGAGNGLANIVTGNPADNLLAGHDGADRLDGGAGNDSLDGGSGVDTLDGGAGTDTADYSAEAGAVTVSLAAGSAVGATIGTDVLSGMENVRGSGSADALTGDSGANQLDGGGGNDTLDGGQGIDTLVGGAGDDTHLVRATATATSTGIVFVADVVSEAAAEGMDTVYSNSSFTLSDEVDNLVLTGAPLWRAYVGTGNGGDNTLTGEGAARHRLYGEGGADTLDGGGGRDTLDGGAGDDVLVYEASDNSVNGGADSDTLRLDGSGVTLDLTLIADTAIQNVEVIDLTGTGANTLTLALADVLAISSTTDTLRVDGDAGDVVNGGGGWTDGGIVVNPGYHTWTQGLAMLLVDVDITQNLSP